MDLSIVPRHAGFEWELLDLLGREVGSIKKVKNGFLVQPVGQALNTMRQVPRGPHNTLDGAILAIEKGSLFTCRFRQ